MSFMDHCPIYAFNKSLQYNANNKIISDGSAASASLTSKNSPASSHQRQASSPRQTRNSLSSPITEKFEKDTTSTFEKRKSPLKTEPVIGEHKSRSSDDSLLVPISTIRSQRRSPRTSSSIEAKIPKLELAKSLTPVDPKFVSSAAYALLESKVVSSPSPTNSPKRTVTPPTRVSRSTTLTTMGKIKWGEKPPPNKRKESLNGSSRSPSKKITTRLADIPTSPRLAASIPKKPKKEESSGNADANFVDDKNKISREERKLQATIASIERAEHLSQEKKRKQIEKIHPPSEPPITTKLKRKSFNAKTSSVKSLPDESSNDISCKKLSEELNKILKIKLDKLQEFKLPSDFDPLRTEVMERSKATATSCIVKSGGKVMPSKSEDHSERIEKTSKLLRGPLGYATTSKASITEEEETTEEQQTFYNQKMISPASDGCVWEKEQISECSRHLSLSIPELIKDSKTASAPPTTINTSDASDVEKPERASTMDVDTETPIRPPNTKAHKKITLEEYKRKKKAEMEAKQQQNIEENTADKKSLTIHEPSTSRPSSSTTSSASSLVATRHSPPETQSYPPLSVDMPPPLPPPPPPPPLSTTVSSFDRHCLYRPQSERLAMSLDDRLKKFVKRTS
uniref:WH2 domain-containing protein n=1 Tax=Meloidogyne hapla TaxID=6305 RepID=A0A1I8B6L6_MELHA